MGTVKRRWGVGAMGWGRWGGGGASRGGGGSYVQKRKGGDYYYIVTIQARYNYDIIIIYLRHIYDMT